jgi:hypothetical protein
MIISLIRAILWTVINILFWACISILFAVMIIVVFLGYILERIGNFIDWIFDNEQTK